MPEKRRHERTKRNEPIQFAVTIVHPKEIKRMNASGLCVDAAKGGIGLLTAFELEPGHLVLFTNDSGHKTGIVAWSEQVQERYRVGIKFV